MLRTATYLNRRSSKDSPSHLLNNALDQNGDTLLKGLFGLLKDVKKTYPLKFLEKLIECLDVKNFDKQGAYKLFHFETINSLAELIIGTLSCKQHNCKFLLINSVALLKGDFTIDHTKIMEKINYLRRIIDVRVISELKTIRDRYACL